MPRPSSIPDFSELEQWLRSGLTPKECSERYAARGIHVTPVSIAVTRYRRGWPRVRMDHSDLIPWVVQLKHRRLWDHRMLMEESARRQGRKLNNGMVKSLASWKARLDETDSVVHYQPDTEQGWFHVPRRPGMDDDLIREPSAADEDELGLTLRR